MHKMTRNTASLAALVFMLAPAISHANDVAATAEPQAFSTAAPRSAPLVQAAAPAIKADKPSHPSKEPRFKNPKLKHGVLRVNGTEASDKIALRLQAGNPAILQVDVDDDGSADFSFERKEIARIAVGRSRVNVQIA